MALDARFFHKICEVFINFSRFRQLGSRAKFFRNVRELEICWTSKSQLRTTLGGHKNAEKPKRKKVQTLNGRLPPEDGSVRPENLAKRVSDDSQHLIFRRRKKKSGTIFSLKKFSTLPEAAQSCPEPSGASKIAKGLGPTVGGRGENLTLTHQTPRGRWICRKNRNVSKIFHFVCKTFELC